MRNFFGFWLFSLIFLLIGTFFFLHKQFPAADVLSRGYPMMHYLGKGKEPAVTVERKRPANWVDLNQISRVAVGAVIVSEDWAFYTHNGFDLNQIIESAQKNWSKGKFARGGSTITQQVAKNVFLDADKTLWRKFRELLIALELEQVLPKRKILEIYFNIAEWGEGVYGIKAASYLYFQKHPSQLSAREGAFIAALLPSPKKYSVSYRKGELTPFLQRRIRQILQNMLQAHFLSEEQYLAAKSERFSWEQRYLPAPDLADPDDDFEEEEPESP